MSKLINHMSFDRVLEKGVCLRLCACNVKLDTDVLCAYVNMDMMYVCIIQKETLNLRSQSSTFNICMYAMITHVLAMYIDVINDSPHQTSSL